MGGEGNHPHNQIPLPIQTFLWRQTSPFLGPKLSKHCEATCMSFERILVQNIHHGLSPSISDALKHTPRWLFLKAALPNVMHCCSSILKNYKEAFSNYESKMLYTLHWLILNAASECEIPVKDSMHPTSSIQLFVYLFAPLLHKIEGKQFCSLKLQPGLKIWEPMWEFSQPEIPCMSSAVKPRMESDQKEDETLDPSQASVYTGIISEAEKEIQRERLDIIQATYFDVAVLQCLMNSRWSNKGVIWALNYVQRRLDEILESHQQSIAADKSRSMSMPLPIIEVSMEGNGSLRTTSTESPPNTQPNKDDDEWFIPATRITNDDLPRKRPKTEYHQQQKKERKKKHKSASDLSKNGNLTASSPSAKSNAAAESHHHLRVNNGNIPHADTEETLADIKEENSGGDILPSVPISAGEHRLSNSYRDDSYNRGLDKKAKATPLVKVTGPNQTDSVEHSSVTGSRSKSEPDIMHLTPEFCDEASGSVHYITDDGCINYDVILRAVHLVMLNSKEQDVGIQVLKVVDKLLQLACLTESDKTSTSAAGGSKTYISDEKYQLFIETVIRCVVALGCPTCSHLSTPSTSSSRYQTCMVLHNLQKICNEKFCKYFRDFSESKSLDEIIDFFHSYMSFCTHGNTRNLGTRLPSNSAASGYATNFGHSLSGEGHRGVEGIIVVHTLKTFVTRLSTVLTDPTQSDNVLSIHYERLYHNARKFLNYTQDIHGGTFRRVAFSGLLDATKKMKEEMAKKTASNSAQNGDKKKFQRKSSKPLIRGNSLPGRRALSDSEMPDDSESESKGHLSPGAPVRDAQSDVDEVYTDDEDTKPKLSFTAVSHTALAIVKARRKVKDHIKLMSSTKQSHKSSATGTSRRMSDLHLTRSLQTEVKEKRLVDIYLIRAGMLRFSLLMSVSEPGSLPEPEFLAALLTLDAPIASKACLYLECAYFVNQCTQGNWPSWMQSYSTLPARSATFKRTVILQRAAAALFYRWAEAIGLKLKDMMETEGSDIFSVINGGQQDKTNSTAEPSSEEDFLDEATFNQDANPRFCPHALKMVASLLLYEITTFLREVYQVMAVVHPQHQKTWQSSQKTGRRSSSTPVPAGIRPSSPTPERESSAVSVTGSSPKRPKRWALVSASITKLQKDQSTRTRVSLMGVDNQQKRASGVFGSSSSINSTAFEPVNRKASGGMMRNKKLSAVGSTASSTPGVMMRSARSIKLKNRDPNAAVPGARTAKLSTSTSPFTDLSSTNQDESSVFYPGADSSPSAAVPGPSPTSEPLDMYSELYNDLHNKLNWLTPIIQLSSASNFICEHTNGSCNKYCFLRQNRSCQLLVKAVQKVYEVDVSKTVEEKSVPIQPMSAGDAKRPSVTRLTKSSSQILLANVVEATIGKRRSFDKAMAMASRMKEPKKIKEKPPIMDYLQKYSNNLMCVPLSIILKSAAVLREDELAGVAAVAWEYLLQPDKELVSTAVAVILMVAGQVPQVIQNLMLTELHHVQVENRVSAVKRFYVLWTFRYQVWSRLEPGAQIWFKAHVAGHQKGSSSLMMPPSIDYTLPSPPLGLPGQIVPDPPWMPLYKLKLEELAANQEGSKSLVTATNTRRKQQQEMVAKALVAEECRKREAREAFPLSTIGVSIQAAQEFTQTCQQEVDDTADETQEVVAVREVITAHSVFPTCVCLVGLALFDLLEDSETHNSSTVSSVADSVIRSCMIEDSSLFFRYLFEKLTNPERRNDMFTILRKLLVWMPNLPSNAAYILLNNLVGYVLFYNRSTNDNAAICMSQALSVIWQLVPSVQGLYFKDMKTMLKKVQSEHSLMITSHLPATKKIIVHGLDSTLPPQQFLVHEDTQFKTIMQESLEYFSISDDSVNYQLADAKTNKMYSRHSFVRDHYVFRRNNTPQLKLLKMEPAKSYALLQKQMMDAKFIETCKVELTNNILRFTIQNHLENQVLFLHEEFSKQVAFPRKALETEFSYFDSIFGDEMNGIDVTHKHVWIQFLNTLFKSMPGTFGWTNEMKLFLNVINGCLINNSEDDGMLRMCAAIYLNVANHFKQVFATEGFLLIMPTLIKVYNKHLNHPTVKSVITFLHSQFYELHRRAYLLQFVGSYEPFLSASETKENTQLLAEQLFILLHSLEKQEEDILGILHLIWGHQPLKTLDFCYDEDEDYKVLDAINTMITVVAYQTETHRSTQMLVVLEAIMPWYMKSIVKQAQQHRYRDKMLVAGEEVIHYGKLSQSIKALITGAEALMKPLAAPHRLLEGVTSLTTGHRKSDNEDSVTNPRTLEEGRQEQEQELELRALRTEFRKPRDALLSLVSEFFSTCLSRLEIQKTHLPESLKITPTYFLDSKSHERLEEVAHTLLKVGTYDAETLSCRGLQRYMQEILPEGDWSQEKLKPSINSITKRLERIFVKVHKRANVRALADWDALATLLRGICLMLESQPTLHHIAHMRSLVNACISIVLEYGPGVESGTAERWNVLPNHIFCSMVAKLAAQHAAILGETGGIEQLCGGSMPSSEKAEMMLANFVIPLCLRIGGNDREKHMVPQTDIRFILCLIISSLVPRSVFVEMLRPNRPEQAQFGLHIPHHVTSSHVNSHIPHQPSELLKKLALLGLKTLLVCCDKQIYHLLPLISQSMNEIILKSSGPEMWRFFDFFVTIRTVVYPLVKPYIHANLLTKNPDSHEEAVLQNSIRLKIHTVPSHIHKTQLLSDFANQLDKHRNDLTKILASTEMTRTASHSIATSASIVRRRFSTWRKNSLISKLHQNEHQTVQAPADRPVINVNAVRAQNPSLSHVDDETPQQLLTNQVGGYNFTRNLTSKGSRRYTAKTPLKHIHASDGARLILDKFNNNNQPPSCAAKQYYERLANTNRRGGAAALQLIRQPHVIFEEDSPSTSNSTPELGFPSSPPADTGVSARLSVPDSLSVSPDCDESPVVSAAADLNGNEHVLLVDTIDSVHPTDQTRPINKNFTFPRTMRALKADGDRVEGQHLQRRAAVIRRTSRAVSHYRPHLTYQRSIDFLQDEEDPPTVNAGYNEGHVVVSQSDVKVMIPGEITDPLSNTALLEDRVQIYGGEDEEPMLQSALHRQGGLYLHASDENDLEEETTPLLDVASRENRTHSKQEFTNTSPIQAKPLQPPSITTTDMMSQSASPTTQPPQKVPMGGGLQQRPVYPPGATSVTSSPVMMIRPESVVVDFLPMTATIQTANMSPYVVQPDSSKNKTSAASSGKGKKKLGRTGSDTVELMPNEHPIASSDSDYRINPPSETTTNTSIESSPSTEEIPYIDSSSDN